MPPSNKRLSIGKFSFDDDLIGQSHLPQEHFVDVAMTSRVQKYRSLALAQVAFDHDTALKGRLSCITRRQGQCHRGVNLDPVEMNLFVISNCCQSQDNSAGDGGCQHLRRAKRAGRSTLIQPIFHVAMTRPNRNLRAAVSQVNCCRHSRFMLQYFHTAH